MKVEKAFEAEIKGKHIIMPNANEGKGYTFTLKIDDLKLPDLVGVEFAALPEGLQCSSDGQTASISGVPTVAGEHKIKLQCTSKDGHKTEREMLLVVNFDPKKLWKNIPTPNDVEYYKPDSDKGYLSYEGAKNMVAASQRGRSHAQEGKPRDDDFKLHFDSETGWYIMVVADGAGSAPFSRKGSQIACQTAKNTCSKYLAKNGISDVLDLAIEEYQKDHSERNRSDLYNALHSEVLAKVAWEAYSNIRNEATEKQLKPKEYATTLLLSICKKFDFGWFVGAFWVGDGGIGIYRQEPQDLKILGEPDGGEFAGQTRFLTMPEIFSDRVRTRFEIVEDFTAVILMTDGITDPKFETDANLKKIEKWDALWSDLHGNNEDKVAVDFEAKGEQTAETLLKWLDFWSKGNHDDRTIAILY